MAAFDTARAVRKTIGCVMMLVLVATSDARMAGAAPSDVWVVRNDRGGSISDRLDQIARIRAQGMRVEIRAGVCLSSCTMLLTLKDLCIGAKVQFGFHGPSHHGQPLRPAEFDYWSDIIARHDAPALRRWFMQDARFTIGGYKRLSGAKLIQLGYPSC